MYMKNSLGQQLMQEENSQDQVMGPEIPDEIAKKMAIANIRAHYGLPETANSDPASYLANAIAKKQNTSADLQAQTEADLAPKLKEAGEMGMEAGTVMGSIGNIGKFSAVRNKLASELGAAKKASNLVQLQAKPAAEAMKTGTKMASEEKALFLKKLIEKGLL